MVRRTSEIPIIQKDVTVSHKTLGCKKSIIGNDNDEMVYVRQISDRLGNLIKNAPLDPRQGTLALNLVYIASLKYGLSSSSLTFNQIEKIQCYTVDKFISTMSYDHSTLHSLIYGPVEYGGMGVRHLYTEMMGMKLDTVISHLQARSDLRTFSQSIYIIYN
jgi:hypothetical protein